MNLYSENKSYKLYQGNMLDMLEVIEKESIDSIVCDPPYGLTSITKRFGKEGSAPASTKGNDGSFARLSKGFMGKQWDGSGIEYNIDAWKQCYEVLKPGGYLLAFGGSRTYHRIACAIEDAGFEIRDTIMWLYGSGFPKSMNIGLSMDKKNNVESEIIGNGKSGLSSIAYQSEEKTTAGEYEIKKENNEWNGWGTALKPSFEPIIVARKPFKGTLVDNVIKYGVGGINIDECRVGNDIIKGGTMPDFRDIGEKSKKVIGIDKLSFGQVENAKRKPLDDHIGRFPANTILTYDENDFEEVCGGLPMTGKESASRYFYCAKASKKDRDEGLDEFEEISPMVQTGRKEHSLGLEYIDEKGNLQRKPYAGTTSYKKNMHPTVKPTTLMQYLVRLVTPNGGTVLDPFNGSGSTGKAVMYENKERNKNYKYIGIELTEEYLPIAKARIEYVCNDTIEQISIDKYNL